MFTDWRSDHPVLRHVSLDSVVLREAWAAPESPSVQVLARFGEAPLVLARTDGARREVMTTFDPEQSNLPLRVAFPVLLYNAIDWLADGGEQEAYLPGRTWRFPGASAGAEPPRAEGPGRLALSSDGGEVLHRLVDVAPIFVNFCNTRARKQPALGASDARAHGFII